MTNARLRAQLTGIRIWFHDKKPPTIFAQLKGEEYLQERGPLTEDDVARLTAKLHEQRLVHTCLTCTHWNNAAELCTRYNTRPPAHVIAYGCPTWTDLQNGRFTPAAPTSLRT